MLIRSDQIEALGVAHKNKFIEKTMLFARASMPEWADKQNDTTLREHIDQIIALARQRNIKKEINIQKLLYHWIKYDLSLPVSKEVDAQLVQNGLSEDFRVKCMIKGIKRNGIR